MLPQLVFSFFKHQNYPDVLTCLFAPVDSFACEAASPLVKLPVDRGYQVLGCTESPATPDLSIIDPITKAGNQKQNSSNENK